MVLGFYRDEKLSMNMNTSLSFKKKTSRIDWRKIAAVDLDRIAKELDVYSLQENIDHITFCNIENEIDTRMMDPNYVKLFKISQFTIEYLMHSQTYLTDVISTIEVQLNSSLKETDELKKTNEKIQKDLVEVKKENKKRKKLIETQQTLMNATASNYHQCAFCSKVFLNISYLQAHMTRRHPDMNPFSQKPNGEIEKELERIKERLRLTELDLAHEKNSRLNVHQLNTSTNNDTSILIKQIEETKNNEIKRQKDEMRRMRETFKKENYELSEKILSLEKTIKELQERLGKQSNVGWIKDDVDVEKDTVLKMNKEMEILNQKISNYENEIKQFDELKAKHKLKEESLKKKILEKDELIQSLKTRLAELENAANKTDRELVSRNQELLRELEEEKLVRYQLEKELAELKNRPPPITPRQPLAAPQVQERANTAQSPIKQQDVHNRSSNLMLEDIYLPEYCPLTQRAVQENPNHLQKYRTFALDLFSKELDEIGIDLNEKGLSQNDFKLKMNMIKNNRPTRTDNLTTFNELKRVFAEISDKHAVHRMHNSSLKSSLVGGSGTGAFNVSGNRVTFKPQTDQNQVNYNKASNQRNDLYNQQATTVRQVGHKRNESKSQDDESEETNDDVSLSNALESEDDDDTEPTKSQLDNTPSPHPQKHHSSSAKRASPIKTRRSAENLNQDDQSDLESLSQLLSDRSAKSKRSQGKHSPTKNSNPSTKPTSVEETKRKIEKQLQMSSNKGYKPHSNAVPIGFGSSSPTKSKTQHVAEEDDEFPSITDIDLENENKPQNQRAKNGLRTSLQDSQSSSIWVSESHSHDVNLNNPINHERPPTANSSRTLDNFESDD